jgi:hypothetical protein
MLPAVACQAFSSLMRNGGYRFAPPALHRYAAEDDPDHFV